MSAVHLEDLTPDAHVTGLSGDGPATVIATTWQGTDAVTVTFQDDGGGLGQVVLYRDAESGLEIVAAGGSRSFDADGADFRLAAEAQRIRLAGLFDPMLAVATSDVEPLPHQIRAVYGELLPRRPLRFLLADDPGAGKTIMAGLYLKELVLRGEVGRCLVVAPGGLVEQWQDELSTKFGLDFEILGADMIANSRNGMSFAEHPRLIARMDMLSRNDELMERLARSEWDLAIVDEAHRLAAHYFGSEVKETKRYRLGRLLGRVSRNLLLMTATPHAGSEQDFQLFLALLDPDRFEGRYRAGVSSTDTTGLMRRMVKERLLTFEGKPLFPERRAETVPYELSPAERALYEDVTSYVREEMNRAESIEDGRRRTVGFALTVLQRRLASSPAAIHRSLQRRRARLEERRHEVLSGRLSVMERAAEEPAVPLGDDIEELDAETTERLEDTVTDAATAARTVEELAHEIAVLDGLELRAARIVASGEDRKWRALASILEDQRLLGGAPGLGGAPRKLIVFTEHKDTLRYLVGRISALLGRPEAVVAIHGGVDRQERRRITAEFTNDPACRVLVATDAAGEGLNLQRAHLMVNYDLPWNPNRIEQRFGRIHRIGQTEVCRLWNLVAEDTREGEVFARLLEKIEEQRRAYHGEVFDVLGGAFARGRSLHELLVEAVRYGDRPEVRARLDQVIDATVGDGIKELLEERALSTSVLGASDLERLRRQMDEARVRRLQPHFVEMFVRAALDRLGGRMARREQGRWEVTRVPAAVRHGTMPGRYERVTFEPERIEVPGGVRAELLAPGHPLVDALIAEVTARWGDVLGRGAVLVDPGDQGTEPRLLAAVAEEIADGTGATVAKRFGYVQLGRDGRASFGGQAPYLDFEPLPAERRAMADRVLAEPWLAGDIEGTATGWAVAEHLPAYRDEVAARVLPTVERTRAAVRRRLLAEINRLEAEAPVVADQEAGGKRVRVSSSRLRHRAEELAARLARRCAALDRQARLSVRPPYVAGMALVLPAGLVRAGADPVSPPVQVVDTVTSDRRAVAAVLTAERALGRMPEEMAHNNPGYDIESLLPDGHVMTIEVKGRIEGATEFFVTATEILTGKNAAPRYRLALVSVSPDGPGHDEVRYVDAPFDSTELGPPATGVRFSWTRLWALGRAPF